MSLNKIVVLEGRQGGKFTGDWEETKDKDEMEVEGRDG